MRSLGLHQWTETIIPCRMWKNRIRSVHIYIYIYIFSSHSESGKRESCWQSRTAWIKADDMRLTFKRLYNQPRDKGGKRYHKINTWPVIQFNGSENIQLKTQRLQNRDLTLLQNTWCKMNLRWINNDIFGSTAISDNHFNNEWHFPWTLRLTLMRCCRQRPNLHKLAVRFLPVTLAVNRLYSYVLEIFPNCFDQSLTGV